MGLSPGAKISGGKVLSTKTKRSANRVRQALKMAAMSLWHSDSALGAFYRSLCSRMDKPRANTAVAHKLVRLVYFMLTRGEAFVDKWQQYYTKSSSASVASPPSSAEPQYSASRSPLPWYSYENLPDPALFPLMSPPIKTKIYEMCFS